ncbi:MAG: cytochrome c [Sulfuricella sp.]|nr:cytochrome c [Sulfuricella sp.]
MRTFPALLAGLCLAFDASSAAAQNLVIGKALFDSQCSSCHGQPPRLVSNGARAANNASMIRRAISGNSGGMRYLSTLSDTDLSDIAAYLGNYTGVPSNSATSSERLFNWAEWKYQSLLAPRATTQSISQYAVRYFSGSGLYVGVAGDTVYLYDQNNPGAGVNSLGSLAGFLSSAANDGF